MLSAVIFYCLIFLPLFLSCDQSNISSISYISISFFHVKRINYEFWHQSLHRLNVFIRTVVSRLVGEGQWWNMWEGIVFGIYFVKLESIHNY